MTGLLGVLALAFQLLAPSFSSAALASGDLEWIEICSETGVTLVQVETDTGLPAQNQPYPECGDALCLAHWQVDAEFRVSNPTQFWSHLRGPPPSAKDRTVRASRASMASTPDKGDAPWT